MQRQMSALREIERRLGVLPPSFSELNNRLATVETWAAALGCKCELIEDGPGLVVKACSRDEARVLCDKSSGGWMRVSITKIGGKMPSKDLNSRVRSCEDLQWFLINNGFTF
jgi:hypothetical protein